MGIQIKKPSIYEGSRLYVNDSVPPVTQQRRAFGRVLHFYPPIYPPSKSYQRSRWWCHLLVDSKASCFKSGKLLRTQPFTNLQPSQTPPYLHPSNPEQGLPSVLALYFAQTIALRAKRNYPPYLLECCLPGVYKFLEMLRTFAGCACGIADLRLMMIGLDRSF